MLKEIELAQAPCDLRSRSVTSRGRRISGAYRRPVPRRSSVAAGEGAHLVLHAGCAGCAGKSDLAGPFYRTLPDHFIGPWPARGGCSRSGSQPGDGVLGGGNVLGASERRNGGRWRSEDRRSRSRGNDGWGRWSAERRRRRGTSDDSSERQRMQSKHECKADR